MAEMLVDHVRIDVRVWVEATPISRVTETVTFLLLVLSKFSTFLAYLLDALDLVLLLEILLLDVPDAIFILQFKCVQLVHAHIHDVTTSIRVGDHLT